MEAIKTNIFDPREWYRPRPKTPEELGLVSEDALKRMGFKPYVQNPDFYVKDDEYYLVNKDHSSKNKLYYRKL